MDEWRGTTRYEVLGRIGAGGMGVVYEAFDRERRQLVALKTVLNFEPAALYRFKQEFRTLADVQHPNLVHLFELVAGEERVFFAMELVHGTDFLTHVRPGRPGGASQSPTSLDSARSGPTRETARPRGLHSEDAKPQSRAHVERLLRAMRQLVAGVSALHDAGKLHRDIKPSNVLVTPEGRVVLLDFGVATELSTHAGELSGMNPEVVGTASYMAPEQAEGTPPTPASDWYSVGVMLYEALVGRPPFVGSAFDVISRKMTTDPLPPSACVDGIPPSLDRLCRRLLEREPGMRPTAAEIGRDLGTATSDPPELPSLSEAGAANVFVGREPQREALREAFDATREGRSITVCVAGAGGMGKSTLVHHVLDELGHAHAALVLRGRAYEREAIPYKAVDAVIDALSRQLLTLEQRDEAIPLPADTWLLARLFPVLQRVSSIRDLAAQPTHESLGVRMRAFVALRQLLAALAERLPLVVFIDDVHWGDADSAALLLELVRPPSAPPLLLIVSYRAQESKSSSFLAEFRGRWPESAEIRDIHVNALDLEAADRLALALLGEIDGAERTAWAVARESRGSPFLVEELVRSNRGVASAAGATLFVLTLDQMVSQRLETLPPHVRLMAELLAIARRPLAISVIADAAGAREGLEKVIGLLGDRRFARRGVRDGREVLETTHDRIGETIVDQLSAETLTNHHRRLAEVLGDSPEMDAEAVAMHWLGAGEKARAADLAAGAGEQAAAKFAFDQASRLLRLATENTPATSPGLWRLRARHAELLQLARRHEEAGRVYLEATAGAPVDERLELQRAAGEQLLASGRIDEGRAVLHRVLAEVGLHAPRSPLAALFWLIVYRIRLVIMGLGFKERHARDVSRHDRLRIDALFTASLGFAIVDVILGACMQARHLIEALRKGDRFQVLRAASLEAALLASGGRRETRRERALVRLAADLAERHETDEGRSFFRACWSTGLFQRGRWKEARALFDSMAGIARYSRADLAGSELFAAHACYFMGDLEENARRIEQLRVTAEQQADPAMTVNLRTTVAMRQWLAADNPERARLAADHALDQWPSNAFFVQHAQLMLYAPEVDLYVGEGGRAYERFMRDVPAFRKSLLLQSGFLRVLTTYTRGRVAIASIESQPRLRAERIAEARRMARRLEREHDEWVAALAALLRAMTANAAGQPEAAIDGLRRGIAVAESTSTIVYAVPARYRLGELLGDDEGRRLMDTARETMTTWGVRNHPRWVAFHIPGRWVARRSIVRSKTDPLG